MSVLANTGAIGQIQNGSERLDYLDGWRGLAIALVLQAHFVKIDAFGSGRFGVDVFFCLSGLLMSKLLFIKRTPLLTFYERRISRIFPVFLMFVGTMYLTAFFVEKPIEPSEVISTVTFSRTYFPASPHIWTQQTVPTAHLWSLNVEEHCYIFMSLLTLVPFLKKREYFILISAGVVAILFQIYYGLNATTAPVQFGIRTECAASCVMISAGYSLIKDKFSRWVTPIMPVISFAIAAFAYTDYFPLRGGQFIAAFLLAFTVNHLEQAWKPMLKALTFRPLRLLGCWSYSLYIWQQPFSQTALRDMLSPAVAFVLTMIIGIASFNFFENPVRQWLNERKYVVYGSYLKRLVTTGLMRVLR